MKHVLSFGFLLAACGDGSGTTQRSLCDGEARATPYVAGLEQPSERAMFKARFVEGTPAPPDRGDNAWKLEIVDAAGAPRTDLTRVRVRAWMPDHGHGTSPSPWNVANALQEAGRFAVGPMNLFMGGYWEFTIEGQAGDETDTAIVGFCIEG